MKNRNHNRHDYGQWGNSNFAQNTSAREHERINSNFNDEQEQFAHEPVRSRPTRYDFDQNSPYGQPTWGRSGNEAYVWQNDGHQQHNGMHWGKGPKLYKRSDERILEDIHDRLTFDNFLDASNIEVTVANGEVTLTGTVSERVDKRRAEDIAESVSGVQQLENRIRVNRAETSGDTKDQSSSNGKHFKSLINSH